MNKNYIGFLLIFLCYLNNFGMSFLFGSKKEAPQAEVEKKFPQEIFEAIDQQDINAVAYYIVAGQVNYMKKVGKDEKRLTPLVNAIKVGNEAIICLLISCGADIHRLAVIAEDEKERFALEWAVRELWFKDKIVARRVIELLLKKSSLNEKSRALREASILGRQSPVEYLLEQGADPLQVVYGGESYHYQTVDGEIVEGGKNILDFNSFASAKDPKVRDILFAYVIAEMKKGKPEFATKLERTYEKDEIAPSHEIELEEEEQGGDGLRKRK